jgi:hypothetical protein
MHINAKTYTLAATALAACGVTAHAAPFTISDSFDAGVAGDLLDGTTTEVGGETWTAASDWVYTSGGEVTIGTPDTSGPSRRTASIFETPDEGSLLTLSIDLIHGNNAALGDEDNWGALGFIDDNPTSPNPNQNPFVLLRQNGEAVFYPEGFGSGKPTASLSGIDTMSSVTLSIVWDTFNDTISASAGGSPIGSTFTLDSMFPLPSAAGFSVDEDLPGTSVDNFSYTATVIPEPTSIAGLLGLGLLAARRRR